jgi:hypothetical protein
MFIRQTKVKAKGHSYIVHRLVESYKNKDGKPRQRVIMNLGKLELPRNRWKELAWLLKQRITGQITFKSFSPELEDAADALFAKGEYAKSRNQAEEQTTKEENTAANIDLSTVTVTETRSLGPELVADNAWKELKMDEILADCGMKPKQISVAKALVIGRLIHPASELETWKWFNDRTTLPEMTPINIQGIGIKSFYKTADKIYENSDKIETALYNRESILFSLDRSVFLFDLTNTYFEGSANGNSLAKFGKSKERRSDCKLATLALVVDAAGFPVYSKIYEGNQPEPETLSNILDELNKKNELMIGGKKPVLVMDRGIATEDNLSLIKKKGYDYTVIERGPKETEYEVDFRELKEILNDENAAERLEKTDWIDVSQGSGVYVKKIENEGTTQVLTLSVKKEDKELSMDRLKEKRFLEDIEKLCNSVKKGNIILLKKVSERIGRIKQKYSGISGGYAINLEMGIDNQVRKVEWTKIEKGEKRTVFAGCYVIETSRKGLSAEEIWRNYTTITRVEAAFRDLKSDLGLRPIHHQIERRTKSHLFIGVLAYHLLVGIETKLKENGDHRDWKTIRNVMSTHQRTTVIMSDVNRTEYHIRVSGRPETQHSEIYKIVGISSHLNRIKKVFNKESSA